MMNLDDFERLVRQQSKGAQQAPVSAAAGGSVPDAAAPGGPLDGKLDQQVTIRGTAGNAVLGAVLVLDTGEPVYIEGLHEWPDDVSAGKVEVTGVLRRRKLAPDPGVAPDGGATHGMVGTALVLEGASWSAVSP